MAHFVDLVRVIGVELVVTFRRTIKLLTLSLCCAAVATFAVFLLGQELPIQDKALVATALTAFFAMLVYRRFGFKFLAVRSPLQKKLDQINNF